MKQRAMTPEQILADHPVRVRQLANTLRALVQSALPEAEERAYPVWHGIGYRHPEAGYLCGIFPFDDCVKIYFEYGRLLPDPSKLFSKKGTQTGQVVFKTMGDIRKRPLQQMLHESVEFGIQKKRGR